MSLDQYVPSGVALVARDADTSSSTTDWAGLVGAHILTTRMLLSFSTVIFWDFVITISQSINLFWMHNWSISKMVFLLNRFNATILMANAVIDAFYTGSTYCHIGPWVGFIGSTILMATFNLVLLIRVYALWNRSLYVYYLCLATFFAHIGTYLGIIGYSYSLSTMGPSSPPFTGCLISGGYPKYYVVFINSLVFESIIIFLTVVKAFPVARQRDLKTPLFSLLLEDGLLYYALIIIVQILVVAAIFSNNYKFAEPVLGSYPSCVVMAIACNRLLLRPQQLLFGRGQETLTSFHTTDLRTTASFSGKRQGPSSFTFSKDLPGERLEMEPKTKSIQWASTGSKPSKRWPSVVRIDAAPFTTSANHSSSQSGSDLDKEVDISGHPLTGIVVERENLQQVEGGHTPMGGEIVMVPENGPFTYGNRRTVLDPTYASPESDERTGNITISRIGQYN